MSRSTSILIQPGFNSRLAAIKAVNDTGATFATGQELRNWLRSPEVAAFATQPDWTTLETRSLWLDFVQEFAPPADRTWSERTYLANVNWTTAPAPPGSPVSLHHWNDQPLVISPRDCRMALCHMHRMRTGVAFCEPPCPHRVASSILPISVQTTRGTCRRPSSVSRD